MPTNDETFLDARERRRLAREDRDLARIMAREDAADAMVGELIREGRIVYYVSPPGGRYREGTRRELIAFLIRNNYA